MALRWGIASAGKISHDFVTAMSTLPLTDHKVVAVAARELKRAQEFAKLHGITNAYEGYEPLAKDTNVDIVYIGNLNPQHLEVAMMMLKNNKHVLCEKPLCLNYKQAKTLIDYARSKNLFLMEAVWSRFMPTYVELRNLIKNGTLGDVNQLTVDFGQPISHVSRVTTKSMGGGTILDLGIYVLQLSQMIFGEEPKEVKASGHLNQDGVDMTMGCVLTYPSGGTAMLGTNSIVKTANEAVICGTKGIIRMPMFWCPTTLQMPDGTWKEFPLPQAKIPFNFHNSSGLRYEAEECRRCIKNGWIESPIMSHSESLLLAKLEDTIRKQLGVEYDVDK